MKRLHLAWPALAAGAAIGCASIGAAPPSAPKTTEPAASVSTKADCVVLAAGDVMMGTHVPSPGALPPDDGKGLFANVRPFLRGADIVFANLEGSLDDDEQVREKCKKKRAKGCYQFVMPTAFARRLSEAGFNVVSINNNHALDAGSDGLQSTRRTLDAAGIRHTGPVGDIAEFQIGGASVAVVGFGFNAAPGLYSVLDVPAAQTLISRLKQTHRIVIVSFHGGAEGESALHLPDGMERFENEDRGDLRRFARGVVDAGADLVIGHSPHVARAMELYHGRLIAYSLGNFQTYAKMNLNGHNKLAPLLQVRLDIKDGTFLSGKLLAFIQVDRGIPVPDPQRRVVALIQQLSREDIPDNPLNIQDDGTLSKGP